MFEILPRRGPAAFKTFEQIIASDYPWLAERLSKEYKKISGKSRNEDTQLVRSINSKLIPLVFEEADCNEVNGSCQGDELIDTFEELLTKLETKCIEELGINRPEGSQNKKPLHVLIYGRVKKLKDGVAKIEKQKDEIIRKLNREIKDMKIVENKLRNELECKKKMMCSKCDKRDSKTRQDVQIDLKAEKKHSQDSSEVERLKREIDRLKNENAQLKNERPKPKLGNTKDKQRIVELQNKLDELTKEKDTLQVENNVLRMQLPGQ